MKKIAQIKFNNGAKFQMFFVKKLPKLAKEANDYMLLKIIPEKGRGEEMSWYLNIYDADNLIWLLSTATLHCHENDIPVLPKGIKERVCEK